MNNDVNDINQNNFKFFDESAYRPECRSMRVCSAILCIDSAEVCQTDTVYENDDMLEILFGLCSVSWSYLSL